MDKKGKVMTVEVKEVKRQSQTFKKRITPTPLPSCQTDVGHNVLVVPSDTSLPSDGAFQEVRSSSNKILIGQHVVKVPDSERYDRLLNRNFAVKTPDSRSQKDDTNTITTDNSENSENDKIKPNKTARVKSPPSCRLRHDIRILLDRLYDNDCNVDSTDYWRNAAISLCHAVTCSKIHMLDAVVIILRTAQYLCNDSSSVLETFFQVSVSGLSMIIRKLGKFVISQILSCRNCLEDSIITDLEACNDDFNSKDALDNLNLKWFSDKFDRLMRNEVDKNDLKLKV